MRGAKGGLSYAMRLVLRFSSGEILAVCVYVSQMADLLVSYTSILM